MRNLVSGLFPQIYAFPSKLQNFLPLHRPCNAFKKTHTSDIDEVTNA